MPELNISEPLPSLEKHICIVSPSLKIGGIARVLSELANYWVRNGYKVSFISCLAGSRLYKLDSEVNLIEPEFYRSKSIVNKLFFYPRLIFFIRREVLKLAPDRVLTFGDTFNPLVVLSLLFTDINVFISDRTSPDYRYSFPNSLLKKLLYPMADGFIAQTEKMKIYRQQEYPMLKIEVIPNPISQPELLGMERQNIILYVGRFAMEKGPERLILAFSKLQDVGDWELHMAGEGPMLDEMKILARELNLQEKIRFLGKVDRVSELYSKASIFVLPSKLEGFPNSLCEAMSYGLPCVTFDSFPFNEIFIDGRSGKAIPDGNIDSLADYLRKLILEKELRNDLGRNARNEIKKLGITNISHQFEKFMNL